MTERNAQAQWTGTLKEGKGVMQIPGAGYEGPFTFASRFESGEGTNPEELVGAAISGCFSMFLSALISKQDLVPTSISTSAVVTLGEEGGGPKITQIQLTTEAQVPGLSEETFKELVQTTKEKCPISRLYTGTDIQVEAKLTTT